MESKHLSSIVTTPHLEETNSIISLLTACQVRRLQQENAAAASAPSSSSMQAAVEPAPANEARGCSVAQGDTG